MRSYRASWRPRRCSWCRHCKGEPGRRPSSYPDSIRHLSPGRWAAPSRSFPRRWCAHWTGCIDWFATYRRRSVRESTRPRRCFRREGFSCLSRARYWSSRSSRSSRSPGYIFPILRQDYHKWPRPEGVEALPCPVHRQSGQTSRWRRRSSVSDETGVRADVTTSVPAGASGQRIGEA